jgi:hypothetical protein
VNRRKISLGPTVEQQDKAMARLLKRRLAFLRADTGTRGVHHGKVGKFETPEFWRQLADDLETATRRAEQRQTENCTDCYVTHRPDQCEAGSPPQPRTVEEADAALLAAGYDPAEVGRQVAGFARARLDDRKPADIVAEKMEASAQARLAGHQCQPGGCPDCYIADKDEEQAKR